MKTQITIGDFFADLNGNSIKHPFYTITLCGNTLGYVTRSNVKLNCCLPTPDKWEQLGKLLFLCQIEFNR